MAEPENTPLKSYTAEEVAQHNKEDDCWLILGEPGQKMVYDITKFLDDHPGGPEIILDMAGMDSHEEFEDIGHSKDARDMLGEYLIGTLKETTDAKKMKPAAAASASTNSQATTSSNNPILFIILPLILIIVSLYLTYGKQ